jgi:hypothetical protein
MSVSRFPAARNLASAIKAALSLAALLALTSASAIAGPCTGPGAPTTTETKCLTAIAIPGNPLRSFDISWDDPERGLYFLGDRSNSGVDIISTKTNTFIGRAGGFVGILPAAALSDPQHVGANNNISGPDGVVSRGNCLYAGDGNSTLRVYDISDPTNPKLVGSPISTGGTTRLDEMALTSDGKMLIAANNAEDPPFATLFMTDPRDCDSTVFVAKIEADAATIPPGAGLSIEQPTWVESIHRFIVSVPTIANNSFDTPDCNYGSVTRNATAPTPCSGAVLVIDPTNILTPIEKVVSLNQCGPNGATVGPNDNVMVGCTPNNQSTDKETTIISTRNLNSYVDVGGLSGSDEVWFNEGSNRYYTGSSAMHGGAVLGVVNGTTNFLVEAIPQSSASHSVAADSRRNEIFVPQVAPKSVVGIGGEVKTVGAGICGSMTGCIAVYSAPPAGEE